jgi:hypothetical protein
LDAPPWLTLTVEEISPSQGPARLTRQVQAHDPVLRWRIPNRNGTGDEVAVLVGREANRFMIHSHREYFSHEHG